MEHREIVFRSTAQITEARTVNLLSTSFFDVHKKKGLRISAGPFSLMHKIGFLLSFCEGTLASALFDLKKGANIWFNLIVTPVGCGKKEKMAGVQKGRRPKCMEVCCSNLRRVSIDRIVICVFTCLILRTKNPGNAWCRRRSAYGIESVRLFWSCYPDSNWGPHPYQGCALPTEL